MKRILFGAGVSILFLSGMSLPGTLAAATLKVPGEYSTIQAAINAAVNGDTVQVGQGIYYERLDFKGKNIAVVGAGIDKSFIDAGFAGRAVTFKTAETSAALLQGFTVRNGKGTTNTEEAGGCVYVSSATPTLKDLLVTGCATYYSTCGGTSLGGGIYAYWTTGTLTLTNVSVSSSSACEGGGAYFSGGGSSTWTGGTLSNNTAYRYGGAIRLGGAKSQTAHAFNNLTLFNNAIYALYAQSAGVAIYADGGLTLTGSVLYGNQGSSYSGFSYQVEGGGFGGYGTNTLKHNVIVGNTVNSYGGGVFGSSGSLSLHHNLILANSAGLAGGNVLTGGTLLGSNNVVAWAKSSGGVNASSGTTSWSYNDVYQNTGGDYVGIASQTGTNGNISVDPGFLSYNDNSDWTDDQYNLAESSLLIDAGLDAYPDPDGSQADIGLYGGGGAASLDFDHDGVTFGQGDCNDWSTAVPGAEVSDGLDNDCDGVVDEDALAEDNDGDGFSENQGDCNDAASSIYPGAVELADGVDQDCDGRIDDGTGLYDDDGDGYTDNDGDCNDEDAATYPGAIELADGVDNDCDGVVDEGTDRFDDDADGYTEQDGDCDDANPDVNPGATEEKDGIDNDCDGRIDETSSSCSASATRTGDAGSPAGILLVMFAPLLGFRRRR